MDKSDFFKRSLTESSEVKLKILDSCEGSTIEAIDLIVNMFKNGGKLLLCGNGGSAADCQHIATEFMIRLNHEINRPALPAIAITTDSSNLTAGGNDIGYENIFARNVEGLGNKGDILLSISTSGNSKNVIKAIEKAKEKGMINIALLGGDGGKIKPMVDCAIIIPSENTQRIQEGHITVEHIICELVELELYK